MKLLETEPARYLAEAYFPEEQRTVVIEPLIFCLNWEQALDDIKRGESWREGVEISASVSRPVGPELMSILLGWKVRTLPALKERLPEFITEVEQVYEEIRKEQEV